MKRYMWIAPVLVFTFLGPLSPDAGDYDGTTPLLCATIRVLECLDDGACSQVEAELVGMPQFFMINFDKKEIRTSTPNMTDRISQVENIEHIDGKLIIQGIEDGDVNIPDGLGWSLAISEETGKWILSASGDQVAFVVYGVSTPDTVSSRK
jgi:hypothetical protein